MRRVLIVDDDHDIRVTLRSIFESEGFDVSTAANGKDGLEVMKKAKPSLVLLDLTMPLMDGWEFLEHHKKDQDLAKIPIVVITAGNANPESQNVRALLRKPMSMDRVLQVAASIA